MFQRLFPEITGRLRAPLAGGVCVLFLLAGCDSSESAESRANSAPLSDGEPATGVDSVDAAAVPSADEVDLESLFDDTGTEVSVTDKSAVIEYTTRNTRKGAHIGERGGVSGLVPVDTNGLNEAEAAALAQARRVLATHLELDDVDEAELVEISQQQWSDSGLGCARAGEMSAQVITEGYRVVLVLAGLRHQVHTGRRGGRVCERLQGMLQAPRRAVTMSALPRLQQQAIGELASLLNVAESEIKPGRVSAGRWPDAALGCPEEGVEYSPLPTGGYFLPLKVNGRTVNYRTDGKRVVMCDDLSALKPQAL